MGRSTVIQRRLLSSHMNSLQNKISICHISSKWWTVYPSAVSPVMISRGKYKNRAHESDHSPSLAPYLKWLMSQYLIMVHETYFFFLQALFSGFALKVNNSLFSLKIHVCWMPYPLWTSTCITGAVLSLLCRTRVKVKTIILCDDNELTSPSSLLVVPLWCSHRISLLVVVLQLKWYGHQVLKSCPSHVLQGLFLHQDAHAWNSFCLFLVTGRTQNVLPVFSCKGKWK